MGRFKRFFGFLGLAWISAFLFEEIPRFAQALTTNPNIGHLWQVPIFFLLWYGIIFTIAYFLFIGRPTKQVIIFGIIFGLVVETFYFKTLNIISFFLFLILYGLMFYLPFKAFRVINYKEKIKNRQIAIPIVLMLFVIIVLVSLPKV